LEGKTHVSARRRLNLAMLGVAGLALMVTVGLSYWEWTRYSRSNAESARTREIVAADNRVLLSLVDAETGQRGFLLTGEDGYLEPYNRAIQEIPNELAALRTLLAARPDESRNLAQLETLADQKLSELHQIIELRRTQRAEGALVNVRIDQGKRIMDAIRAVCAQIERNENAAQSQASVEGEAAAGTVLLATATGSLVLLFLFAFGLEPFASPEPLAWQRPWPLRYGAAILAVVAVALLRGTLTPLIGATNLPFTMFFFAVAFAAWFGGFGPAVLSIALSLPVGAYFFAAPTKSLWVSGRDDQVAMLMIVVVGFGVALLSRSQRDAVNRAERSAAEAQSQRERLSGVIDSAMDAIITVDHLQRILIFNHAAEQIFRCPTSEALGQPLEKFIPERFRQVHHGHIERFGETAITNRSMSRPGTLWGLRASGEEFPIEATISQVGRGDQRLFTVILRDLTERLQTEEELRREREQRSFALTAGKMGAYEMNLLENTLWWSPETYSLFGVKPDDFVPTQDSFAALVHPAYRDLLLQHFRESIACREPFHHEFRILRADGTERWISCQGQPEYDGTGRAIHHSGIFLDISARKQSEQMLRKWEKLSSAARLSAAMAHEVNNPLGAVVNLIYLAKGASGVPAVVVEQLALAEQELERVAHVTRQVLGFYRESNAPEPIDIPALVESLIQLYSPKIAAKKIKVERAFGACASIQGVRGEVRQAVSNVLLNAIDAVGDKGVITVACQDVAECMVEIVVADDGPGVAAEDVERIFEPLFTTKAGTGTGLGLWVTKEIIERHGGGIAVRARNASDKVRGATFTIRFPRTPVIGTYKPLVDSLDRPKDSEPGPQQFHRSTADRWPRA
jgi:PAS domain S-box-containing protein